MYMGGTPRIYPSLPEYTPLFKKFRCATLPESTPPSQNIPPFQQMYNMRLSQNLPPPHSQNILPLSANLYVRPCQNLPLPPRINPPYQPICATLPESTPHSQYIPPLSANLYVRPFQNLPLPPRIYPLFNKCIICDPPRTYPPPTPRIYSPYQPIYMCDPARIYPSLPEYTPLISQYVRPCQNLPLPLRI